MWLWLGEIVRATVVPGVLHNIRTTSLEPLLPGWAGVGRELSRRSRGRKKVLCGLHDAVGLGYRLVRLIDIGRGRAGAGVLDSAASVIAHSAPMSATVMS